MATFLLAMAQALYLFVPLLFSALLSGIVLRFDFLPALSAPIDGGVTVEGRRLFGEGKTWRGVVTAIVGSVIGVAIQRALPPALAGSLAVVDYRKIDVFGFGAALGIGATLGELPNSFVKRRLGIPRGQSARGGLGGLFYVWDQVDLLTGVWPLLLFWMKPGASLVAASFAVALVVHPLVALVGYLIGARASPR